MTPRFIQEICAEIGEMMHEDPVLKDIIEWINAELGESPEAIRGALCVFGVFGSILLTGVEEGKDASFALVKVVGTYQAQPHVMAMIEHLAEQRRRDHDG